MVVAVELVAQKASLFDRNPRVVGRGKEGDPLLVIVDGVEVPWPVEVARLLFGFHPKVGVVGANEDRAENGSRFCIAHGRNRTRGMTD